MTSPVHLPDYVTSIASTALHPWMHLPPWEITSNAASIVRSLLDQTDLQDYVVTDEVAVHHSVVVEPGATLKGPLLLGPHCFVAAGAYLRSGNWAAADCSFGPGTELKSSFVLRGTKLAHFNFVGDSIVGEDVNLEAGSIICNYRNERADKEILVRLGTALHKTGVEKFGALVGDRVRIGANAVVAPGALLTPTTVISRTALCDQAISVGPLN
jgi:bifunctional N-acetylglucosamine-1-phosphate-uridyltransferase/glucosamine-1-phosphate-acetyltransferase GlmU-like protein